jgi:hypothetical protein
MLNVTAGDSLPIGNFHVLSILKEGMANERNKISGNIEAFAHGFDNPSLDKVRDLLQDKNCDIIGYVGNHRFLII